MDAVSHRSRISTALKSHSFPGNMLGLARLNRGAGKPSEQWNEPVRSTQEFL
jgi:hypothetical protein